MSKRPELKVSVGADLFVKVTQNRSVALVPVRVVKVARAYATVERTDGEKYLGYSEYKIEGGGRRLTSSERNYGSSSNSWQLVSQDQLDYDQRLSDATALLYARGFEFRLGTRPTDGDIIATARALRMIEDIRRVDEEGNE